MLRKSIFSRLLWAYVAILVTILFVIAVAANVMLTHYMVNNQKEQVIAASDVIEYWTATFQIEQTDARAERAYKASLGSWSQLLGAEITVSNIDGEIVSTTADIHTVPTEYMDKIVRGHKIFTKRGDFGGQFPDKQLTVGVPVRYNGNVVGAMFFNTPMKRLNATTNEIIVMFII